MSWTIRKPLAEQVSNRLGIALNNGSSLDEVNEVKSWLACGGWAIYLYLGYDLSLGGASLPFRLRESAPRGPRRPPSAAVLRAQ